METIWKENQIIFIEQEEKIGSVDYSLDQRNLVIHKVFVHEDKRGLGKGHEIMNVLVSYIIENHMKIKTYCSFAEYFMVKNNLEDLLA